MIKNKFRFYIFLFLFLGTVLYAHNDTFVFAVLKYDGGGDWYNGLTGVRHLLLYTQQNTDLKVNLKEKVVSLLDDDLFLYPFLYINGHGNITLNSEEQDRLKMYLENGGFLFCNDDYGLDKFLRRELKKIFPDKDLSEVPFSNPIYHSYFDFDEGLPKIHKHEGGAPKGYGLFVDNKLVLYYDYDADIADGWEEQWVHHDPWKIRESALKMGVNILYYALLY